jgi:SAM-dependent methyltransferase
MIQVLPHLADPLSGLQRAVGLLKPNGFLLIETWDRDSRAARMLGKLWQEYSPPSVIHWFNLQGLVDLLTTLGCSRVSTGRPTKRIVGAHIRSIVGYKFDQHRYLKWLKPTLSLIPKNVVIRYRPSDLFWVLFQRT